MNKNRIISAVAVTLSAALLISTANSIPTKASAVAGAVASMQGIKEPVIEAPSSLSGTNLAILNMLIKAEKDFDEGIVKEEESVGALLVEEETEASEPVKTHSEFEKVGIANVSAYVNVRALPSEEAEVVGKMYPNAASVVMGYEGEWAHVISGTVDGYVHTDYLVVGDPALCEANSQVVVRVRTDALNVRSTPDNSVNDNIMQSASLGDGYRLLDTLNDNPLWIKVAVGDKEGYVCSDYVTIHREYASVAESRAEEERRLAEEKAEEERQKRAAEEAARKKSEKKKSSSSSSSGSQSSNKTYTPPTGSDGSSVANFALQFVGNPYRYGGTSLTNGTDCSGFVMSVYSNFGVGLPHSSSSLRGVGYGVSASEMQAGDIVCYSGHVGICIGGGQIVHASNRRDGIKVSSAYYRNILAVRRIY